MKKLFLIAMTLMLGVSVMAQQKIQLRSADKAECVRSDMRSLQASFSFSSIDAQDYESERGTFSWLSLPNTVMGGNEGDPQIPVVNELIAVPFGANPRIEITSYSTTDYRLEDYGIHTLVPRQPAAMKNQHPEFVYNEAAYQTRGLHSEPVARVSVNGTMRGVQVGQLSIEPVSYDPVNNTIRVFNNIEVEIYFDGADARATENMLVKTYSPYFDVLYKQLFNGRAVRDVYEQHPDLWTAPVKMLVIANRMFESCIQDWVAWKTTKGIYVDVNYTDNIGTSADAIKSFIQTKYAQDAPTFLIIMGDKDQVAPSVASASQTNCVADLYYSSVDGDEFVDMYHSRISAETVAEMQSILSKGMEYEQYTMPDPSYLNNVLLIAGEDSGWGVTVGRPTIWYATNYYYNAEHGFNNVYEFSHGTYTNCYAPLSSGVGFANYTAHGSKTSWAGPAFTVDDVANLTNAHKYFLAIGNCCQSGDFGYSTTCFGEAMIRAENKGAYAYIGSCPNTTWKNDYYFGVGPTNRADGTMPSYEETGLGIYDAIWLDDVYNTVSSILYVGLLAGNAAEALGYELHSATLYYWQAYHVLGDGSIMPYRVQPTANNVSHMPILPIGMPTYEVSAVPGSYVAISKDGVLHGTALVGETGTVQVPITPVTSGGNVTICVTAPNRIPYIQTVPAAALEGAYIAMDSYTPTTAHVGDNTNLSIIFKNVGTDASIGTTNITLTTDDPNVTLNNHTGSFGALAPEATATVNGFSFSINSGVADGTNVTLHYTAVNGSDTYEGNIVIKANEAVLAYQNMSWNGGFVPGETLTLTAKFKNIGHYQATNAVVRMSSSSNYLSFSNQPVNVGTIAVDQEVSCQFTVTIAANCPETAVIPVTFTMTANGSLMAEGNETLKNSCIVTFDLHDSYSGNDGWNNAKLTVSFDDGTPSQDLTIANGSNSATYPLEIGNGTHVTLTWTKGNYDNECSFTVSYEGNLIIYQMATSSNPSAGVLYEFDCNCAAASQTFNVTVVSENTVYGTVSGGGEYSYGESCTVTATPVDGYMFTGWTQDGTIISGAATYTFIVNCDMNLVAHFAEGTMIGDGGDATSNYLPAYNYYTHSLTEQIYTSAELGGAGVITSISFYNEGAEKTLDYDFFMKSTTKSTFSGNTDWIAVSDEDKVFSGSVTMSANAWTTITLSSPFVYDGTSNVVLVTNKNTYWSNSPHMSCRVFNAPNQAIYVYSDGTEYNPLEPPTSYGSNEYYAVFSQKNQLLVTWETSATEPVSITVSVNPELAGTVSGGGEYTYGETCTIIATPNEGYTFVNWTHNGTEVSTEANYSFTVTEDVEYVANFSLNSYEVMAASNLVEGGTVAFSGDYNNALFYDFEDGTSQGWTIFQGSNGDSPDSWMHCTVYTTDDFTTGYGHNGSNGFMLSESLIDNGTAVHPDNYLVSPQVLLGGSISFWVTNLDNDFGAEHFEVAVSTSGNAVAGDFTSVEEWTLPVTRTGVTRTLDDGTWYEYTADLGSFGGMGYVAIHHFDCYDQWLLCVDDITVVEGYAGFVTDSFSHGETCTLVATANTGYAFMGWTEGGEEVSTEATYSFEVTGDRELVANFEEEEVLVEQSVILSEGMNWWSTNLDITLDDLKSAIEAALEATGGEAMIKSNTGFIKYQGGRWRPTSMSFDIRRMYQIQVSTGCTITLTGVPVDPAEHPITVRSGANWIGYLSSGSMTVESAFSGLHPVSGDVVKSSTGSTTFTGTYWRGSFDTLEPGKGYIYHSKATEDKTFIYGTNSSK